MRAALTRPGWWRALVFTVLAGVPGHQASAGSKHGDIGGKHVANEFLNARSSCRGGQVLNQQCADTLALPWVVNQKCELSLIGAEHLIRGNGDDGATVFGD